MDLTGARVLVTGGGRRLGAAIARDLAAAGCDIAIGCHGSRVAAERVRAEIRDLGRRSSVVVADLAIAADARRAVDEAADALGGLDAIVHGASGGFRPITLADLEPADVDVALGPAVTGTLFLAQGAAERLTPGGALVLIGDVSALNGWPSFLPHSAAKGALRALTSGLARALAPTIRVAIIHPGTVLPGDVPDDHPTLVGRSGRPADVCAAIRYLLTADFVTGAEIVVDGGRSLR